MLRKRTLVVMAGCALAVGLLWLTAVAVSGVAPPAGAGPQASSAEVDVPARSAAIPDKSQPALLLAQLNQRVLPPLAVKGGQPKGDDREKAGGEVPIDERSALLLAAPDGAAIQRSLAFSDIGAKTGLLEVVPDTITVPTSKRAVLVAARCKAKVGWFVTNTGKQPVEYLRLVNQPFILVFPNPVDEVINVYAYTAVDGTPTMARATITVGTGKVAAPTSGPAPPAPSLDVKPLPPGSKIHFTIIHDAAAERANPRLADLVTSTELLAGLRERGDYYWAYDKTGDAAKIKARGFDAYMEKVGVLPMFIVQDLSGLVVDYRALSGTPAGILAYLDKLAPRK